MTTHGHEHPGIFHRRQHVAERPTVSSPETSTEAGNGGPDDPKQFNGRRDDDPRKKRNRLLAIGTTAVATLGVAVGAGFLLGKGGEKQGTEPRNDPSVSASADPTEAPSSAATSEPTPSTTETGGTEPIAITIDYKKFEGLTPAEFATHTYDEQAQYDIVQYEDVETTGALYKEFEPEKENLPWLTDYSPARMPLHEFSDAKEMELQSLFTESMIKSRKANIHDEAPGPVDKAEAKKLLPGYALPGSPAYKSMDKTIDGMTEEGTAAAVESASATSITILRQTPGVRDVDGDGKPDKIRTIIMSDGTNAWTVVRTFKPNARLTEIAQAKGETREAGLWPVVSVEKSKVTVS